MGSERGRALWALGKGTLTALGATILGMLILAAALVFWRLSDGALLTLNQLLKLASILLGARVAVNAFGKRGFAVGAAVGLAYMVLGYALYCLLDGGLANPYVMAGEFAIGALAGALCGALFANLALSRRPKRA